MNLNFAPAVRHEAKARVALIGPTGSGKTWTALEFAGKLGDNIAVIDTENGSASLYSDQYTFQVATWRPPYDAAKLASAIQDAARHFDVLVLDSLTHFWAGDGGVLDVVDREAAKMRGNTYAAWKAGTPLWRSLLDSLLYAPCHVIVTMRSKMDYVQQQGADGRTKIEKVGMAPQARNDVEYEFTVVGELDQQHRLTITKSRCATLADQVAAPHQAGRIADVLVDWLGSADTTVQPDPPPLRPVDGDRLTDAQLRRIKATFREIGVTDRAAMLGMCADAIGHTITSSTDLTKQEAAKVIDHLEQYRPADAPEMVEP